MVGLGVFIIQDSQSELQDLKLNLRPRRLLSDVLSDEMARLSANGQLDQVAKKWSTIINKRIT
jgi:hypothetical protein